MRPVSMFRLVPIFIIGFVACEPSFEEEHADVPQFRRSASDFYGPLYDASKGGLLYTPEGPVAVAITYIQTYPDHDAHTKADSVIDAMLANPGALPGFVGISALTTPTGKERWLMSAWVSLDAMQAFVDGEAHSVAKTDVLPVVSDVRTTHFLVEPSAFPPAWEFALNQLETAPDYR